GFRSHLFPGSPVFIIQPEIRAVFVRPLHVPLVVVLVHIDSAHVTAVMIVICVIHAMITVGCFLHGNHLHGILRFSRRTRFYSWTRLPPGARFVLYTLHFDYTRFCRISPTHPLMKLCAPFCTFRRPSSSA